jgi:hypothetical protein
MPPMEFEPTISSGERPQFYALDCAATETGYLSYVTMVKYNPLYLRQAVITVIRVRVTNF